MSEQGEIKFMAFDPKFKTLKKVDQITFARETWNLEKGYPVAVSYRPDIILLEYTGHNDDSNNKIYEGDIVDCCRYENKEVHRVIIKDIRSLTSEMFGSSLNWRKIVGNIYENPELIN